MMLQLVFRSYSASKNDERLAFVQLSFRWYQKIYLYVVHTLHLMVPEEYSFLVPNWMIFIPPGKVLYRGSWNGNK